MNLHANRGHAPEEMFFAAYAGPSMNPTLCEPEIMEILPYAGHPVRVGDVAFFLPPAADQPVVHRVVRVTPEGIFTIGDNNLREDSSLLPPASIKGRVVAAWRGQKRRKIAGGLQGRWASRWLRWQRAVDHRISPLLHPVYQAVHHRGLIARLLPARYRPRVVVFRSRNREQYQLLMGKRVIGRYDDFRRRWQIQRPFHLIVNGKTLPGRQDREPSSRQVSAERQPATNPPLTQEYLHSFVLADGTRWEISAGDEQAASIVAQLGAAMQLSGNSGASKNPPHSRLCRLLVQVDSLSPAADSYVPLASETDGVVVCTLSPCDRWGGPHVNLTRLSLIIAREAQARGGFLIHGALAELDGHGVILAAPGGTGKTTASSRFPAPWRSLSDDTTLVVRNPKGSYLAHPWPTWSRFLDDGPGGAWDVQRAVPVNGFYFLNRADEDRVERVGSGQAVSLLGEFVRQVSTFMTPGLWKEEVHTLYLERFNNLCALAGAIPAHVLHISQTGTFWKEIEQALETEGVRFKTQADCVQ